MAGLQGQGVPRGAVPSLPCDSPGRRPWPSYLQQNTKLQQLGVYDVPFHPYIGSQKENHVDLAKFIQKLFDEALDFSIRKWKKTGTKVVKSMDDERLTVEQYRTKDRDVWFGRWGEFLQHKHPKAYEELAAVLRVNHSAQEAEYTPEVFDQQTLLTWSREELARFEWPTPMENVTMELVQMYHKMKAPITNRVFTVLVLSATVDRSKIAEGLDNDFNIPQSCVTRQFFVVQLPVDLSTFPPYIQSRSYAQVEVGKLRYFPHHPGTKPLWPRQAKASGCTLVEGRYVAVEVVNYVIKKSGHDHWWPRATWAMATASDAGGMLGSNLFKCLYPLTIPGVIAMDVEYVGEYIKKQRERSKHWPSDVLGLSGVL